MALNVHTFKTRSLTALIFVIVMLAGLLWNQWSFFVLFSIIHFGCWIEYQKLAGLIDNDYATISPFHKYGVMIAGWCIMLYFTNDNFRIGTLSLHSIGWWLGLIFVFILPVIELLFAAQVSLKNIGYSMAGLLYISVSWSLMIGLRTYHPTTFESTFDPGYVIPAGLIFSIWINDTMAYIVGSLIGRTPLSEISPKKTWEGTIGGVLLCILVISLLGWWLGIYRVQDWIAISSIAAIIGTIGDLLESKLKRAANIKDSGNLLPGHGGFLDRFDSLILATPFVWMYVNLFM